MNEDLRLIIKQSVNAPSGDNCQPWKFRIVDNSVLIMTQSEGNNDFLDFQMRGTYVAQGALIENIVIVASSFGYGTKVELFPEDTKNATARIIFTKDESVKASLLANAIPLRHTNRKVCKNISLSEEQISKLKESVQTDKVHVSFVTEKENRKAIAFAASRMEKIALENPLIHSLFFGSIVWTREEEKKRNAGLFIKTLELPPPVQGLFKILKHWKVTSFFNKIGFSSQAANGNAAGYASSPLIAVFSIENSRRENFIETGRAMERVWLQSNKDDLAVQPLAGLIYISQRLEEDPNKHFTDKEASTIREAISTIKSKAQIHDTIVSMILRIGIADKATAVSIKKEPIIE